MSDSRTKTGQFAKGRSGNPGGRPKYPEDIKALMQENTIKAVQTIIDIMNDEDAPGKVRLAAAMAILDRALGKPESVSKVELSNGAAVAPVMFRWMGEGDAEEKTA